MCLLDQSDEAPIPYSLRFFSPKLDLFELINCVSDNDTN